MPVSRRCALVAAFAVLLSGCSFDDISLEGKQCPCVPGWTCSPDGVCVDADSDGGASSPDGSEGIRDTACGGSGLADALICDGFEDQTLERWSVETVGNAAASLGSELAYRGRGLLEARVDEGGAHAKLTTLLESPIATGTLYQRFYAYTAATDSFQFFMISSLVEPTPPFGGINLSITADRRMHIQAKPNDSVNQPKTSTTVLSADQWLCVQIEAQMQSTNAGSVTVSVDGEIAARLDDVITRPAAGIGSVQLGAVFTTPSQQPSAVRLDEYVFDTSPIACD